MQVLELWEPLVASKSGVAGSSCSCSGKGSARQACLLRLLDCDLVWEEVIFSGHLRAASVSGSLCCAQDNHARSSQAHPAVLDEVLEVDCGCLAYLHRHLRRQQLRAAQPVRCCQQLRQQAAASSRRSAHLEHQHSIAGALGLLGQEGLSLLQLRLRRVADTYQV